MYWVVAFLVIGTLLLAAGCRKNRAPETDHIDGGVVHSVDNDAPKVIRSQQIQSFYCKFSARDRMREDTALAGNVFVLTAEEIGASLQPYTVTEEFENRNFMPTEAFFSQLQQIVTKYDFAQYNGRHYKVSGLPPDFGMTLTIRYASGEAICASNNQSCFLPLEALEELVALFQNG